MKFRQHRGGLAESMATVVELNTKEEFLTYFKQLLRERDLLPGVLNFTEYGYDNRNGWNTYLVNLEGYGVLGMLNGPPPAEWWPPVRFEFFKEESDD